MSRRPQPYLGDVAVVVGTVLFSAIVIGLDLYRSGTLAIVARALTAGGAS